MPRRLLSSRVPVDLSILEFDPGVGEEIFLTYTWHLETGPPIERTGKGPPFMEGIGGPAGQVITNPYAMRFGSWLIREEMRADEQKVARSRLQEGRDRHIQRQDIQALEQALTELDFIQSHEKVFLNAYPHHEIVGLQGCGDLTMNFWNVAFLNNPLGKSPGTLVCLHNEPLGYRTYSCLVKWKSERGPGRVTIEDLQFQRNVRDDNTNEKVWVRFGSSWLPRADRIDFAASNQQVIRDGELVPIVTTCHQFSDLRHLIQMPNLNPESPLYPTERPQNGPHYRPRRYFGQYQYEDIWLGEEQFLEDRSQNLLRAALSGPVFLHFPDGSDDQILRGALHRAGYREVLNALDVLRPGDWRFVRRGAKEAVLEIYFKRNTYSWSMIGLTPESRRILCLVSRGVPGQTGYTLEDAAEELRAAGAHNALLIDEGLDVFQMGLGEAGQLQTLIKPQRGRLRATFIFARCMQTPTRSTTLLAEGMAVSPSEGGLT